MTLAKDIRPRFPYGFLLDVTITRAVQRQFPVMGRIPSCFGILGVTSCTFKYSSAFRHTKHDCFIAPRSYLPHHRRFYRSSPSFIHWTHCQPAHVGVLEILSPLTRGQAGITPADSNTEFRFSLQICSALLCISTQIN